MQQEFLKVSYKLYLMYKIFNKTIWINLLEITVIWNSHYISCNKKLSAEKTSRNII